MIAESHKSIIHEVIDDFEKNRGDNKKIFRQQCIELDEPVYNSDIILFFYADLGEQGGRMKWKVCLKVLCTTLTQ